MLPTTFETDRCWKLPPLILHPFSDSAGPAKLAESSRASLILQGLLTSPEYSRNDLERTLMEGRLYEIHMLYYVGKDLIRWIEQCTEVTQRDSALDGSGVRAQTFAALLIEDAPAPVRQKLSSWGVADYRAIFARAIGLNSVFAECPLRTQLTNDFVRSYYRYADHLFACAQSAQPFARVRSRNFDFDLFASGEYSRMLEKEWQEAE